jgi:hypothetical protein
MYSRSSTKNCDRDSQSAVPIRANAATRMTMFTIRLRYMLHMNPSITTPIAPPISNAMYTRSSLQRTWSHA